MATAAAPAFVLGEQVDGDAAMARTLLRSILAVVDCSPVAPAWAVSVMRHSGGISVFVTSNEGRGWLPAGLYLPRLISTPWSGEVAEPAWENVSDPARILVEFGLASGSASGARLSAVASSRAIDQAMRHRLPDLPLDGDVTAASEMDLSAPRPELLDRLEFTASPRLLDRVAAVPEESIGRIRSTLARTAHTQVAQAIPDTAAALGTRALRERILTALHGRQPVASDWWDELRDTDFLLAVNMQQHRLDVSRIPLGELRSEQSGERPIVRALHFQRRCNELVLLLAETPDRRSLRDAVYVHAHLTEHPALSKTASDPVRRPLVDTGL
ncbi:hypothetical protein [Nocardia sp. NBC_01327]|uniref:hypothetical protein n=1 Tax=Nocardia sp. NBC_01327 TaxID=2903593 RepID=UPI002E0F7516|nr:hypothetical protein OG326_41785 [Nocardia sp. NBC_01327]